MSREFEKVEVEDVPLEQIREVVSALAKHLGLKLYLYEWMDGGRDFEFRPEK